ncbi:MAG: rRNA maturation RNase YbeY [Bacillota bacterium]
MAVLISNMQEEVPFDGDLEALVEKVALEVLRSEGRGDGVEVSVLLTGDDYIRELNRDYRGMDRATDVLSFSQHEGEQMPDPGGEDLLGDVVISLQTARRQGEEFGHGLHREVSYLTAHGILHLLGYDHEDEEGRAVMREKEEAVLSALGMGKE